MSISISVINGPNLNMLGRRDPNIYGTTTLETIQTQLQTIATPHQVTLSFFQSNSEGLLIDHIHSISLDSCDGILINPGGLTHTSVSLRDALEIFSKPIVEVHLSNIYHRESFRHTSLIAPIASGQVTGFGPNSYYYGLGLLIDTINAMRQADA